MASIGLILTALFAGIRPASAPDITSIVRADIASRKFISGPINIVELLASLNKKRFTISSTAVPSDNPKNPANVVRKTDSVII
jgi:hypothetical protein